MLTSQNRFHEHFRREFNEYVNAAAATRSNTCRIYNFADKPERLAMSLPAFLDFAGGLSHHLHMQYVGLAPRHS